MRRFGDCRTFLDKSRLSNLGEQMMFWRTLFWQICGGVVLLLCHKKKVQKLHSLPPLLLKLVSLHPKSSVTFRKLIQPHSYTRRTLVCSSIEGDIFGPFWEVYNKQNDSIFDIFQKLIEFAYFIWLSLCCLVACLQTEIFDNFTTFIKFMNF